MEFQLQHISNMNWSLMESSFLMKISLPMCCNALHLSMTRVILASIVVYMLWQIVVAWYISYHFCMLWSSPYLYNLRKEWARMGGCDNAGDNNLLVLRWCESWLVTYLSFNNFSICALIASKNNHRSFIVIIAWTGGSLTLCITYVHWWHQLKGCIIVTFPWI